MESFSMYMSAVFSIASEAYNFSYIVLGAYDSVTRSRLRKVLNRNSYQNQRFGRVFGVLLTLSGVNIDRLEDSERRLCNLDDVNLLKWRDSYVTIFNVIPIAGAIFGQVALTGLTLPGISSIHWTARALMTAATTFGIASVVAAVDRSIALSKLYEADSIRAWFSQEIDLGDKKSPLKSSIAAQELLDLPLALLLWGGVTYISGFGVYIGLIWYDNVPSVSLSVTDSRNVFICFMLSLLPLFVWSFWSTLKEKESQMTQSTIIHIRDQTILPGSSLYTLIHFLMNRSESTRPLDGQDGPQHTMSRRPSVLITNTVPNKVDIALSPLYGTSSTSIPVGTISTLSSPRYTIEQSDYIGALRSAATSRRQAAEADTVIAALYEKLAVSTVPPVKTELIAALKVAAQAHQKCVDQDMLVIQTYERLLISQSGSNNV